MVPWVPLEKEVPQASLGLLVLEDTKVQGERLDLQEKWDQVVNLECREWWENEETEVLEVKMVMRARKVCLECRANKVKGEVLADKVCKAWREPLDPPE